MQVKILKGTDEIGGSCVAISTLNTTILVDYGTPLSGQSQKISIDQKVDAILISHPHQDHFGEITNIDTQTPVYCGELSLELMNATKIFTGQKMLSNNFHHFKAYTKFEIGDFVITPYLVDHSAVDAYAFLIEAEGQKILYSGDFRANGRKSKLYEISIKEKKLKNVDVLLMEGTMMQRSNLDFPDEQSVENKIFETIKTSNQISFMIGSSQNIDSIVSAYRACKKTGKIFVVDMYTAWILEKLKIVSNSVPNMSWDDVQVIKSFAGSYYQKIKENEEYFQNFKSDIFKNIANIEDIKANPEHYFLKVSPWHIEKILNSIGVTQANIIYSQWLGYMSEEFNDQKNVQLLEGLKKRYHWVYAHTSGHADLEALQNFASAINPKKLIPIHTEYKGEFEKHFGNVMVLDDNESYDILTSESTKNNKEKEKMRSLNKRFMDDLKDGILKNLLERIKNDSSLDLQFRGDYINVYYRGGVILKLEQKTDSYNASINKKYFEKEDIVEFKPEIQSLEDMQDWIDKAPLIKQARDFHYSNKKTAEREFVQLIVRSNNYEKTSNSTDFFITDMEYTAGKEHKGQIDLLALEWNTKQRSANSLKTKFAFIEVKFGNNAINGKSGLKDHLNDIHNFVSSEVEYKELVKDTVEVFQQKRELGLYSLAKENNNEISHAHIESEKPLFIILLADFAVHNNNLEKIIADIDEEKYPNIDIRFSIGSFMGYGLYSNNILTKDETMNYIKYASQKIMWKNK